MMRLGRYQVCTGGCESSAELWRHANVVHTRENVLWRFRNLRKAVVDGDFTCNQRHFHISIGRVGFGQYWTFCEGFKSFSS